MAYIGLRCLGCLTPVASRESLNSNNRCFDCSFVTCRSCGGRGSVEDPTYPAWLNPCYDCDSTGKIMQR